jgi:predicted HTH domain antitoxin
MKTTTIALDLPSDLITALNISKLELKKRFQISIAIMLFQQGKLTIGKAVQVSGIDRNSFEKELAKNEIPLFDIDNETIKADLNKLKDIES